MKIEELKKGQKILVECEFDSFAGANQAWVSIQGDSGLAQLDDIKLDQPKPILKKEHAEWLEELKNEFSDDFPNQLYHVTRQGWGNGLEFKSTREQKIKIIHAAGGKLKKDLVNALIYGYTVEKEKLYTVKILGCTLFKMTSDNHVRYKLIGENETPSESKFSSYKFEVDLTEQEIKQADERLWQFAKEVTE